MSHWFLMGIVHLARLALPCRWLMPKSFATMDRILKIALVTPDLGVDQLGGERFLV